jgi:hypothetical protein
MTTAISSAGPEALRRYAALSAAQADLLAYEAARLGAALDAFRATCTEYRVGAIDGLTGRMAALEIRAGALAGWVAAVAVAFEAADSGGVWGAHTQLRSPQQAPLRAALHVRINGPLGVTIDVRLRAQASLPGRLMALRLALLSASLVGSTPWLAPVVAYRGVQAAVARLMALSESAWFGALQQRVGAVLAVAGVTVNALSLAALQLHSGQLVTPANSLRAVQTVLRATGWEAPLRAALEDTYRAAWTNVGLLLLIALQQANGRLNGSMLPPAALAPDLLADVGPLLLVAGGGVVLLSVIGDQRNWAALPVGDGLPALIERAFWIESQEHVAPELLHAIAEEAETLNALLAAAGGSAGKVRPEPLLRMPDGRVVGVDFDKAFPEEQRIALPDGTYALRPGALMSGEQRIISYYRGEQVTLVRLNADEFVVGICGLDPQNMAHGPNGLSAVIETAHDGDTLRNAYYTYVREQFSRYLELIPPGSSLHLAGHSMGGGMALRLLNDPEVIAALAERDITPTHLTTVGAVRPVTAGGLPAEVQERHYVDPDDQLAMNVGAGHNSYPGVVFIDNGVFTNPTAAHSGYADADYSALPDGLDRLPYTVDPAHYAVYRLDPPGPTAYLKPNPALALEEPLPPLYP